MERCLNSQQRENAVTNEVPQSLLDLRDTDWNKPVVLENLESVDIEQSQNCCTSPARKLSFLQQGKKLSIGACSQLQAVTRPYLSDCIFPPYPLIWTQVHLEITVQHRAAPLSALQLQDLKLPFTLGWVPAKRLLYLVSKRLVDLVDQPGESAPVYRLGKRIPGVGCLLQVQRTDELRGRRATQQPFH